MTFANAGPLRIRKQSNRTQPFGWTLPIKWLKLQLESDFEHKIFIQKTRYKVRTRDTCMNKQMLMVAIFQLFDGRFWILDFRFGKTSL